MAQSTCVKCSGVRFEMKEAPHVVGTDLRWFLLQCTDCGGVAGVVDFFPNTALLKRLERIEKVLKISS